eukprot:2745204-Rhodomonas_salina.4
MSPLEGAGRWLDDSPPKTRSGSNSPPTPTEPRQKSMRFPRMRDAMSSVDGGCEGSFSWRQLRDAPKQQQQQPSITPRSVERTEGQPPGVQRQREARRAQPEACVEDSV